MKSKKDKGVGCNGVHIVYPTYEEILDRVKASIDEGCLIDEYKKLNDKDLHSHLRAILRALDTRL